jgi:UDP-N-acetyl-D-mannosaminuronic acid dehydrogenase
VNDNLKKWSDDIQNRSLKLNVVGCGYVGLPTATLFADSGFNVTALDIKPEIVKTVNRKACPINEPGLRALLSRNVQFGRLKATLNFTDPINNSDVVIISVQTPIDKERQPNLSFLEQIIADLGRILKQEMLVVVISSVPPGTINGSVKPSLESLSGLKADSDFYLAYVPERISPGKALREFVENTRLVGGVGPNSTKIAVELFKTVCKNVVETDAATAEVAKLAENTFRDINIAFANQLALMCEQANVDVLDVIKLSNIRGFTYTHPDLALVDHV